MTTKTHEHRLRVRYAETDQMGVAHHAVYLVWFEEARTRMMASVGCSYAEMELAGIGLPVRRIELRYRSSARFDEELLVRTRLSAVRAAALEFEYEISRPEDERLIATGWTELACVDLRSPQRRLLPLPAELRARFDQAR